MEINEFDNHVIMPNNISEIFLVSLNSGLITGSGLYNQINIVNKNISIRYLNSEWLMIVGLDVNTQVININSISIMDGIFILAMR